MLITFVSSICRPLLIIMCSYLFSDSCCLHLRCVTDLSDNLQQVELLEEQLLRKAMFAIAVANQVDNKSTLRCPVVGQKFLNGKYLYQE